MSSNTDSDAKSMALEAGAENYLTKPLNSWDVRFQAVSVLKRLELQSPHNIVTVGNLSLDISGMEASINGRKLALRYREWITLELMATDPGRIFSRDKMLEEIESKTRKPQADGLRSIDVIIAKLRKMIEADPAHPELIETVRGIGYRFKADMI